MPYLDANRTPQQRANREEHLAALRLRETSKRERVVKKQGPITKSGKPHPAAKGWAYCPECEKEFRSEMAMKVHMKVHKEQPTKEAEVMLTVDVVALITRITKLEEETASLRAALKSKESEIYDRIQEVQDSVWEQVPKLKDGALLIETSDDAGNTVYGKVKTEEVISAEAEQ